MTAKPDFLISSSNSDDELSFVCPLTEESIGGDQQRSHHHHHQHHRDHTPATATIATSTWDSVDSLKQLNSAERDMLARKEAAFNERRTLEAQIEAQSQRLRRIEAALERSNGGQHQQQQQQAATTPTSPSLDSTPSFDGDDDNRSCDNDADDDADSNSNDDDGGSTSRHSRLEDRLVRTEMRLAQCTGSLATLADEMHALEVDHYSLIVTRRQLENEALHLSRFSGMQFHAGLRTKSLMQLTMSTPAATPTSVARRLASSIAAATSPHAAQRLDRSASVLSFPQRQQQQQSMATPPAIRITYDSSQSMEQSSDGGISSQGGDGAGDGMRDTSVSETHSPTRPPPPTPSLQAATEAADATDADCDDDDDDDDDQGCCADLPACCRMQALRHQIAFEKATLMKNLEVNSEKRLLDEGIDRLQELQRQYVAHEKRLAYDAAAARCVWHKDQQLLAEADDDGGSAGDGGRCGRGGGDGDAGGGMVHSLHASGEMQLSGRYASECTSRSNQSSCECFFFVAWVFELTNIFLNIGGTQNSEL